MRVRKKRHGSERLAALSDLIYTIPAEGGRKDPKTEFANDSEIIMEVGCGKGDFIRELSMREPSKNFLAVERIGDVALVAMEKYAVSRNLGRLGYNGGWMDENGILHPTGEKYEISPEKRGNVRFVIGDAADIVASLPDGSLSGIIANFSDPWTRKNKYAKRRLTTPQFLGEYMRVLADGASFSFKTDDEELFDYTLEMLGEAGYQITFKTRDLHSSERAGNNIITEYERNFMEKGVSIKMLEAVPQKEKR